MAMGQQIRTVSDELLLLIFELVSLYDLKLPQLSMHLESDRLSRLEYISRCLNYASYRASSVA